MNFQAPIKEDILLQIRSLKNHLTPRENGITGKLLKNTGNKLTYICFVKEIWENEVILEDWKTAIICSIY